MLTDAEINHIAKLARIELSDELRGRMRKDLTAILGYVDQLQGVNTEGTEPLYQVTGLQNGARPDEHRGDWPVSGKLSELLIDQAPHHEDRYVKTKNIKNAK